MVEPQTLLTNSQQSLNTDSPEGSDWFCAKTPSDRFPPSLFYLEDEFFNPGSLGQEVQHGEARVGPHSRHGHPVSSARTGPNIIGEPRQVVDKVLHPAFVQTRNVDSDREGSD